MLVTSVLLVLILLYLTHVLLRLWRTHVRKEPPGPWGLPLMGHALFLRPRTYLAFMTLKNRGYPDIMQLTLGQQPMVFLNSYRALKEALVIKGDNFSGRQDNALVSLRVPHVGEGIAGSDGAFWREHRRFALRTLRDFGLGRNRAEQIVQNEVANLQKYLEKEVTQDGSEINVMDLLLRSVSNVICTLTMGEQPGYEDSQIMEVINSVRENLSRPVFTSPIVMFPTLFRYMAPLLVSYIPPIRKAVKNIRLILTYLQSKINSHEKVFDSGQEPSDYIDSFLHERYKLKATGHEDHTYTPEELTREVLELFMAGTDTTSNSLAWGLLLLAIHPDIQAKCHKEIDATVGRERMPSMKDKESLPYLQAVMDEVQRYVTIAPAGILHRNFESDTLLGYHIPANSLIVPFVYGTHHDPRVWERPEEFYPEHFLVSNGDNQEVAYRHREELVPFLIGKRECLGESLAKAELLIFCVGLLQKYRVTLPNSEVPRLKEILLGTDGIVRSPMPHKLVLHPRI